MNKLCFAALAVVAAVFACSASAAVSVGDQGPNYKFDKSWNMPDGADELDDFRGKIVIVERWATWCGPCMANIPHLQGFHDKFNDKGLQICATSDEDPNTIQTKMVNAKNVTYGVVAAKIGSIYETRGIPHCWVLDADGKCIYEGHPAKVTEQMVEGWLETLPPTKIEKELAKELDGAVKAFNKGEYGKSLAEATKVSADTEDEAVKADAKYVTDLLQKRVEDYNGKIAAAKDSGDLVAQGKVLEEAIEAFKGSEQSEAWDGQLKELEKSDAYKDTVKAQGELDKIRDKLEDMRPSSAHKKLEKIAKKYPDTPAGKEAAELAKRYAE